MLREAFDVRSDADYDDYFVVSKDKVEKQISHARFFLDGVTGEVSVSMLLWRLKYGSRYRSGTERNAGRTFRTFTPDIW
ncbi:MAG: hypothetical protein LUH07_00095 [Lachnospiraceae bacterium]|nr:hypothetical protein [Lachnospiraceae bacterium]